MNRKDSNDHKKMSRPEHALVDDEALEITGVVVGGHAVVHERTEGPEGVLLLQHQQQHAHQQVEALAVAVVSAMNMEE